MGRTAIVFSGQGAQHPGMGQDLYDNFKCAKKLFDYAETVRPGTKEQCFAGTDEELKKTENTQPCLYLVDLAAAMALSSLGVRADGCAGFSLGEIAALAFSGAYSPEAGFNLVTERARLMQSASLEAETAMAAILKTDAGTVTSLCETLRGEGDEVYPVNFNSPAQTVIAGTVEAIAHFTERAKEVGARAIPLKVSAAFHSPFMDGAAHEFEAEIKKLSLKKPEIPVYANYTAKPYDDLEKTLMMQMNHPVKWCETVENMIADGFDTFIEAGAGTVLSGLIKKIAPEANVYNAETADEVKKVAEAVLK